jgi:hypothetical protein
MLKKITLKGKQIPVPVPIINLRDALSWIESTLVSPGHLLTKIQVGNCDLTDRIQTLDLEKMLLTSDSALEIKIESPKDLALHALESIYELSRCIYENLQPVAVDCWQLTGRKPLPSLTSVTDDLTLVIALTDHLIHLIDSSRIEAAPVQGLVRLVIRVESSLKELVKNKDWRGASTLLLTRLEPLLKELFKEAEALQIQIYAANSRLDLDLLEVGT